MGRIIVAAALACLLAGSAPAARTALPRATTDRPDEIRGSQVHCRSTRVPSGRRRPAARRPRCAIEELGRLRSSVGSPTETGGAEPSARHLPGLARHHVRPAAADRRGDRGAPTSSSGTRSRTSCSAMQASQRPEKLYAVYYDGSSNFSCGGGPPGHRQVAGKRCRRCTSTGDRLGSPSCDTNVSRRRGERHPAYLRLRDAARDSARHSAPRRRARRTTISPAIPLTTRTTSCGRATGSWSGARAPRHQGDDDYYGHGRSGLLRPREKPLL